MMQSLIEGFRNQLQKAQEIGKGLTFTAPAQPIQNVVIAGLGGSGIGGNLVEALMASGLKVPVTVSKTYTVPNFISANTLFIACSFSGNTEETLQALEVVQSKGAKVFCVTSGGKLLEFAQSNGYDYAQIPNEAPCPRAFLGYSLTQLLYAFKGYGLSDTEFETAYTETLQLLDTDMAGIQAKAKDLAEAFYNHLPVVYADTHFGGVITRFQQQVNENSKQLCHAHVFPEMNHNELVGWESGDTIREKAAVLLIRSGLDHERVKIRMDICKPIFEERAAKVLELHAKGESLITQSYYLIHLLDWVSFYLAEKNGVDPFQVNIIMHLKGELAKI